MITLDPFLGGGIVGLLFGTALLATGFFARRQRMLRNRAGARVLLGLVAMIGAAIMALGAFALALMRLD